MGRPGRPRKVKEPDNNTNVDINKVYRKAMEGYVQMTAPRSESDFGGHDYAYKCGQAKELFRQILKEFGIDISEEDKA